MRIVVAFLLLCAAMAPQDVPAETFYAVSVRTHANAREDAAPGTLYTIDPATAAATVVAPLRLRGVEPIGIVGLAVHPDSGAFYGITGRNSPAAPHSLVKIDPATGEATLIGALGEVGSDIGFSPDGTLYAWLPERRQLATLDLATGRAKPVGEPQTAAAAPSGALAIVSNDTGYVAATGATGTLDRLDLRTGARTRGPDLKGAPFPSAVTNLSFSPWGKLFAVNASAGAPSETMLVTIDPESGQVSPIGKLPTDIEALIFAKDRVNGSARAEQWKHASMTLALASIFAAFAVMAISSRRG